MTYALRPLLARFRYRIRLGLNPEHLQAMGLAGLYGIASPLASAAVVAIALNSGPQQARADQRSQVPPSIPLETDSPPADSLVDSSTPEDENTLERLQEAGRRLQTIGDPQSSDPISESWQQIDAEFDRYRLGPGDSVFVNVQQFPDVSFQATLDLQGNVIVPLVGIMSLQGLTLDEAQAAIQQRLERYLVGPVVDLTLVVQRPVQVTVLGEVVRPGLYPLGTPQLTLALLNAGGITGLANLRTVQVRRTLRDQNGAVVDAIEQNIDLFTPLAEGQVLPDIRLSDGDVIVVPALTAEAAADYDRTLITRSNLGQPTISVRVLNYPGRIGNLNLPSGSDFLDAVTAISPEQSVSNLREVAIIRYVPATGQVVRLELDAKDALLGDFSQNPVLEDNDVIVIGRNFIGRVNYFLNTFTEPFRDVLGFLLFFDTLAESASDLFRPDD